MVKTAKHVVIAGNIATGKSTLTHNLADALGVPASLERWEDNPFLPLAASDPSRWAMLSQLTFLVDAARTHLGALRAGGGVQDRSLQENVQVFAADLHARGHLDDEEMSLLSSTLSRVAERLAPPDLMLFLEAPASLLMSRVRARGRAFEQRLTHEDLERLAVRYERFADRWPGALLRLDAVATDFRDPDAVAGIAETISKGPCPAS